MAKDPAHRYATAEELRADLLRFNEGRSVLAMDDATTLLAAAGATQAVARSGGWTTPRRSAATGAAPAEDERDRGAAPTAPVPTPSSSPSCSLLLVVAGFFLARNLGYLGGDASFSLPNVTGQPVAAATANLEDGRADGTQITHQVLDRHPGDSALDRSGREQPGEEGRHRHPQAWPQPAPVKQVAVPSGLVGEHHEPGRNPSCRATG